jgi:hypothetical protein
MPVNRPYKRTWRQFVDGRYSEGGRLTYIEHEQFAQKPQLFIRAFSLIQKDLLNLFDFVEPAEVNLPCHSFRIHELFVRTCIEVEANCKAILLENGFRKATDLNMADYRRIQESHRLSSFEIKLPVWHGAGEVRTPFAAWAVGSRSLDWYEAYHGVKHERHLRFEEANLKNLLDAVCGLVALLGAQFHTQDFSAGYSHLIVGGPGEGFDVAIGGYFLIKFPVDWPEEQRYEFDWRDRVPEPQNFPF